MRTFIATSAIVPLLLLGWACSPRESTETPPPSRIAIPALGLELAGLPAGFEVDSVTDEGIVLGPSDADMEGTLRIGPAPGEAGTNLHEAVTAHRKEIEDRPGGSYLGAQELVGPLGTAYWSRGRYTRDGRELEEAAAFTLDSTQTRIIRITYVYPAGDDSAERVQTLLGVLGQLEQPATAPPPEE